MGGQGKSRQGIFTHPPLAKGPFGRRTGRPLSPKGPAPSGLVFSYPAGPRAMGKRARRRACNSSRTAR
ncbi:hypothetical protein ROR02_23550 [Pararhodospirillum oryzae]|uniref:Uncharacterized protein n=1 Tax=Pararhodospirillum oryzae TaxID=478448 RepID=A0A512H9T6_9PROT|nr:hypothetical protein ROR02_23550 [Pararhodospirillum oryzae]